MLQGDHLGHLPGPGTEPAEARAYSPGDDVRRIDWAVTARTQTPHVRQSVAERELETTLLVDLTASMSFGTARSEKRDVAIALAAAVGHLASGPGDRLGAVVLSDRVRRLPPRAGRSAVLALLHVLTTTRPLEGAGPSLAEGLQALAHPPRRRGLVVVVSDLVGPAGRRRRGRRRCAASRSATTWSSRRSSTRGAGAAVGRDAAPRRPGVRPVARGADRRPSAAGALRRGGRRPARGLGRGRPGAGAGHLVLRTDQDWLPAFAGHLAARRRLRAAAARRPGADVGFLSPGRLWLLLLVAALAVAYVVQQRRKPAYALRFSELDLLASVLPRSAAWKRHVPAVLVLLALTALTTAFARPTGEVEVPRERATVVVALDVSLSMLADDVSPDRITAAKRSAADFVEGLPDRFDVGLVSFSGRAGVVVPPTRDHTAVAAAVQGLELDEATAIGDAVLASLQAVSSVAVAPGEEPPPARIVLLSDGTNTAGRPVATPPSRRARRGCRSRPSPTAPPTAPSRRRRAHPRAGRRRRPRAARRVDRRHRLHRRRAARSSARSTTTSAARSAPPPRCGRSPPASPASPWP
jgi:hypothetical protein